MKRYLFALMMTAMLMALAVPAFAANDPVTVGVGNMQIGGLLQAGFVYYVGQETLDATNYQAVDRDSDMAFYLKRARMILSGSVIDERVTYYMQTEFAQDSNAGIGDILLDAKLGFHYIPYTGIYVGRMNPQFTFFAPRSGAKLMLIDYPLMNQVLYPSRRQTGLDVGVVTTYLNANLGVFNGRQYTPAFIAPNAADPVGNPGWGDQNTAKDIYFNLIGKPPVEGLEIFAGLWYGMPLDGMEVKDGEKTAHNASVMFIDAGVSYLAPFGLTFVGELLYGTFAWDSTDPATNFEDDRADDTYELSTMAYYVMAGYNFGPMFEVPVELLVRYDYVDPDTLNDEEKHAASEQDALTNITVGVNYYIKKQNAMLSLNYCYHAEDWEDVNNLAGDDTQTGISNDEIKLQAQVAF